MKRISYILFLCSFPFLAFTQQNKIDSLLSVLKTVKEDTNKVNLLNMISKELNTSNPEQATQYVKQAILLSDKIKFERGKGNSYRIMGIIYYNVGKYKDALENYFKALEISEKNKDKKSTANCHNNIANAYYELGDYKKAIENHQEALKLRKEIGDKNGVAMSLNNIGNTYQAQGDYNKSLESHLKALKIREEIDDKNGMIFSFNNIGNVFNSLKNYDKAIEFHLKSLKAAKDIGDKRSISNSYYNIGNVFYEQGKSFPKGSQNAISKLNNAKDYFLKTFELSKELENKSNIAHSIVALGGVNESLENNDEAIKYFLQAINLQKEIGDRKGLSTSYNNLGIINNNLKKYKQAIEYFNNSLFIAKEINAKQNIKNNYEGLAEAYSKLNNFKKAYAYHIIYSQVNDSMFNEESSKQIAEMETKYETEKKDNEIKLLNTEKEKERAIAEEKSRKQKIIIWSVVCGLLLVVVFAGFIFRSLRITSKQKQVIEVKSKETEEQKKVIEEKNKDITDSINYAQRIQKALLASESILNKNLREHFVLFKPKDIVSGDFYWATEKEGRFYLAVCDSTGHGVPGAFMSLLNISFLNEAINEEGIIYPNKYLIMFASG